MTDATQTNQASLNVQSAKTETITLQAVEDKKQFNRLVERCMISDRFHLQKAWQRCQKTPDAVALEKLLQRLQHSLNKAQARAAKLPKIAYPDLPVSANRGDIKAAIAQHQVVIIAGETGSGKTTQLPKMCLELGRGIHGLIAHTQPRRLAARSVATRIAEECETPLGEAIGFKIRFSDQANDNTLVKLMTDGILLAEIQHDRYLSQYDTIIIDEAHERSLNIDFLLGYLKQLLPKRPDLKLIITSATIDPERFAQHFSNAPIISVSGRTYPVEIRYRPLTDGEEEMDMGQGLIAAVNELRSEKRGDILVFLSGEREIRETQSLLQKQQWRGIEVIPLFARLSAAEQNKIFAPHHGQRIILATNVAETSLTVPGIRYVIDPGYARISRYSYRSKVQRLPIEAISQASANQRSGRCGRVADGICIRLYEEQDFLGRDEFTDPEILRTNLASVILQMLSLGLGDIQKFPFVQPPDQRFINDGMRLLQELQAIDLKGQRAALTPLGKQLARLPIDPRYARMVLAAPEHLALDEVIIITAGLSIQDPRERPQDKKEKADEAHSAFADKDSDFIALHNLYQAFIKMQSTLTNNQLRKWCKTNFIHYLRMREWQDIISQIQQASKDMRLPNTQQEPDYAGIHKALATGLLSHVAMFDKQREYLGPRNSKLMIFPGSPMAKQKPKWFMAAELVETSQLFARVVARIEPHWLEPLGKHLTQSHLSEPFWSKKQGAAQAYEKVTLFGLPIIPRRVVHISQREPLVARALFLREGLVNGFTKLNYAFLRENQEQVEYIQGLENKARRRDLLINEDVLVDFYEANIPLSVNSEASFRKWYAKSDKHQDGPDSAAQRLTFTEAFLLQKSPTGITQAAYPEVWQQGPITLPLSYVFDPNAADDGVTVHIPVALLNQIKPIGFDWLVPGLRHELAVALIKALPKSLRRNFVPAPDFAQAALADIVPTNEQGAPLSLTSALSTKLTKMTGVPLTEDDWSGIVLPVHLQMRFAILDEHHKVIAAGRDLVALQAQLQDKVQASLEEVATPELEQSELTTWSFGSLPETFTHETAGFAIQGFPALVADKKSVSIKIFDLPHEAQVSHLQGLYRLIQLTIPSPLKYVQEKLPNKAKLGLYFNPFGKVQQLIDDCVLAGIAEIVQEYQTSLGHDIREEAHFSACCEQVRATINDVVLAITTKVEQGLTCANAVKKATKGNIPLHMIEAVGHIKAHLDQLIFADFVSEIGAHRLDDWQRYLEALKRRVEKLKIDPSKDRLQQVQIAKLEAAFSKKCQNIQHGQPIPETLANVRWMIEELRVSFFAQQLGTKYPISVKRIEQVLQQH